MLRRFESMFPLSRVPLWYTFLDPQPFNLDVYIPNSGRSFGLQNDS